MNAQLLNMMQKDNLASSKQIINDADAASTVVCQQTDQLQQLVITQQKKNTLELILKTVIYLKSISKLKAVREYLIDRLQQLDYFKITAQIIIQSYYSEMIEYNKQQILLEFKKSQHESNIQII